MNRRIIILSAALCVVLRAPGLQAQQKAGAAFLGIDVGARAIGMGGAFTAVADDASASYWNPAGLAGLARREAMAMHSEWIAGLAHEHIVYAQPGVAQGTLAVGMTSLRSDEIDQRDSRGQSAGSFTAADTALTVSYGTQAGASRLGLSVKYVEQRLAAEKAQGGAVDLGILHPLPVRGVTLGMTVQNLGSKMSFDDGRSYDLPVLVAAGVGYAPSPLFTLSYDLKYQPRSDRFLMAWGTEFKPLQSLSLRAGYRALPFGGADSATVGNPDGWFWGFQGFQSGLGLSLGSSAQLDYALIPFGELGPTQRVSFSAKF